MLSTVKLPRNWNFVCNETAFVVILAHFNHEFKNDKRIIIDRQLSSKVCVQIKSLWSVVIILTQSPFSVLNLVYVFTFLLHNQGVHW